MDDKQLMMLANEAGIEYNIVSDDFKCSKDSIIRFANFVRSLEDSTTKKED